MQILKVNRSNTWNQLVWVLVYFLSAIDIPSSITQDMFIFD